jgi:hypothetical protein
VGRDLVTLRLHVCDAPSPRLPSDDVPRSRPGPCSTDRRAGGGGVRPGGVEPHCVALFARAGTRFFCSGCAPPALAEPCGGAPGGNLVVVAQRKVGEVAARRRGRQDGHRRRGGGDGGRIAASAHLLAGRGAGEGPVLWSQVQRSVTVQTESHSHKICCDYKIASISSPRSLRHMRRAAFAALLLCAAPAAMAVGAGPVGTLPSLAPHLRPLSRRGPVQASMWVPPAYVLAHGHAGVGSIHTHKRPRRLAFVCAPPSRRSLASDTHERASSALPVTSCVELTGVWGGWGESTRSRHLRGGSDPLAVTVKPTKPIAGQKPGTSGQRPEPHARCA